jgi:predicted nucleic acid-binding protein
LSSPRRFLVDTSAWIETLRAKGDPAVRARVTSLTVDDCAVLCDLVRLELWNGAQSSADKKLLRELEEQLETVPTPPGVWALARDMARALRGKGLTLPAADLVIAACAEHHGLGLVHYDQHFDQLEKVRG